MKRISIFMLVVLMVFMTGACGKDSNSLNSGNETGSPVSTSENQTGLADVPEGFVKIPGGTFQMGSPETEDWRSDDETAHSVIQTGVKNEESGCIYASHCC